MVKIRAVRAIDDADVCQRYIEGHTRVLTSIGVTKVTSANTDWMYNPAAFVILVESEDADRILGGARIHAVGGNQILPIVGATEDMDPKVKPFVHKYGASGSGELCGLWNSREVAGMGIGSIFLSRAAVAIIRQFNLTSLFALAAPYTIKMAENVGFEIEHSLGVNGTFYYPKEDLLATVMIIKDAVELPKAEPFERSRILDLREKPQQIAQETYRDKEIEIDYNLLIPNIENLSFNYDL